MEKFILVHDVNESEPIVLNKDYIVSFKSDVYNDSNNNPQPCTVLTVIGNDVIITAPKRVNYDKRAAYIRDLRITERFDEFYKMVIGS